MITIIITTTCTLYGKIRRKIRMCEKSKWKRMEERERERKQVGTVKTSVQQFYIYIFMHISSGAFFMIVVIINIMSWRHTFLASAQYKHTRWTKQWMQRQAHANTHRTELEALANNNFSWAVCEIVCVRGCEWEYVYTRWFCFFFCTPNSVLFACSHLFNIITTFSKEIGWNVILL